MDGRFRYSGLKEAAPGDYGICFWMRRSLIVCGVGLAVGALRFQLLVAERMVVGRRIGESRAHHHTAF